jgi:hypothetical protein
VGSISHYGCVLLLSALKQNVAHIPYKGVAPAMNDLMGGQTDFMCDQTTTALPQVAGGKIKALAVLSSARLPQLPNTGTAAEAGYALDVRAWNAIFAPRGTPEPVMARLRTALADAAADPEFRRRCTPWASTCRRPMRCSPRPCRRSSRADCATTCPRSRPRATTWIDEPMNNDNALNLATLATLDTPAAIIERSRMQHNIARMQQRMTTLGVRFRPHVKTTKCADVARAQRDAGAQGITVSTLKEAEQFFARRLHRHPVCRRHGAAPAATCAGTAPARLRAGHHHGRRDLGARHRRVRPRATARSSRC